MLGDASYGHYVRCFPTRSTTGLAVLAAGIAVLYSGGWLVLAVATLALGGILLAVDWLSFRRRMARGRLFPAEVVCESPYVVAVWCDVSPRPADPRPAIRVLRQPLERMTGGAPALGARLAALVSFAGDPHAERWEKVDAVVVNCCVRGRSAIRDSLAAIGDEQWQKLETGLGQLDRRTALGLFLLGDTAASPEVDAIEEFEV